MKIPCIFACYQGIWVQRRVRSRLSPLGESDANLTDRPLTSRTPYPDGKPHRVIDRNIVILAGKTAIKLTAALV
jgi:hypothetical protein